MGATSSAAALPLPSPAVAAVATAGTVTSASAPTAGTVVLRGLAALAVLCNRSRSSTVSPAGTSSRYQGDAFVPTPSGLTVAVPPMR